MRASRRFVVTLAVYGLLMLSLAGGLVARAQTFPGGSATAVHPGVLLSQAQLDYMKIMVQAHQDPFYSAFIKAQNSSSGSLTYVPTGPPAITNGLIVCGSTSNPDYGCSNSDDDGTAAYVQALLWYITGNQTYANNAINIMNYYAKNVVGYGNVNGQNVGGTVVSSSNTPLQAAWDSQKWPRAAEIIRYSSAGWPDADAKAFGQWMKTVIQPQLINGSTSNGNWEISMIEGLINIGVYNDDPATFNLGVTYWKQRIPAVFYYHTDGGAPVSAPRGATSWNGQTVFDPSVDGVQQETCRDFGHAQYSISGALDAAETAGIQGFNLYQDNESITDAAQGTFSVNAQNRLTSALEFNAYYLLNNPVPTSVCGGTVTLQIYPTDEIGYNEYHNRLGASLPYTLQYLQNTIRQLPANSMTEYHIMVDESLTHSGDASQLQPFLMWTNGSSGTLQSGSSVSYTVTVVPGSVPNPSVALSLSGLPSGITYTFSPATVSGAGTSTLTITAGITAPSGTYSLNIAGASGGATFSNPLSILVNAANANFAITPTSATVAVVGGDSANFPVTLTPINNYVGAVNLSVTAGLPAGASATFSSPMVTNTLPASTLTVLTAGTTPPGVYSLTISGTDGVLTNKATALLIVNSISNACIAQLGNYWVNGTLPVQTGTFTAEWDSAASTSLNNSNVGFSLGAQSAFTGLAVAARFNPSGDIDARNGGAFVAASTIPYTAGVTYHFRAVVNVPANTYSLYVTPQGQSEIPVGLNYSFRTEQAGITTIDHWDATSQVGTISLCNLVVEIPDFSLALAPSAQTVSAGNGTAYTATMTPIGGYSGTVTLSAAGLPSGATASFSPTTIGGGVVSSVMTVAASASTSGGMYPITLTGTDGTNIHTAFADLIVGPPCLAPTASTQSVSAPENGIAAIALSGSLGSGCLGTDTLNYSVTANPSHGVLTGTAPYLVYTPKTGYTGPDSFSFTVSDALAILPTSSAAAVTITVTAPVASVPVLGSLAPTIVTAGSQATTLTVNGSGFTSGSSVLWNGSTLTTVLVNSSQVTASVPASDLSVSGIVSITVSSPGGVSSPLRMAIDSSPVGSLVAYNTSPSVTHGQAVSLSLYVKNVAAGWQIAAACYNLPTATTCSYNEQSQMITITSGLSTPTGAYQVLIVTTATPPLAASTESHSSVLWCGLLGLPFSLMCFGGKRRRVRYPAAGLLGLVLVLMVGCSSSGTAPTSSAVPSQASAVLTLTVN